MICDAHAYLGNSPGWAQMGLPVPLDGHGWVEMMDRSGVDRALVAPPGVGAGQDFKPDMDRIAQGMRDYPDRLFGFCRVKPRRGQIAIDELRMRAEEQGFPAVKMNTLDDDYRLDDRRLLDPVIRAASDLGLVMFFHTGDTHGETCQPSMVADFAVDFPEHDVHHRPLRLHRVSGSDGPFTKAGAQHGRRNRGCAQPSLDPGHRGRSRR